MDKNHLKSYTTAAHIGCDKFEKLDDPQPEDSDLLAQAWEKLRRDITGEVAIPEDLMHPSGGVNTADDIPEDTKQIAQDYCKLCSRK